MKLLLINPSKYDEDGNLMKFKFGAFPPVNLLILAGLLKDFKQVKIKIIDEFIEDIPFNDKFDLVGITTLFTSTFPRVIDICKKFRNNGTPVILGGTHATCNYDDCIKYCDSIVAGEAEIIFPKLINDFLAKKKLKKKYSNDTFVDLEKIPHLLPRYELIDINKYYKMGLIKRSNHFQLETSRGCPMKCSFCSVRITHGQKPRFRTIDSVIKEIRFLKKNYNASYFSFTDDNFLVNLERSRLLLEAIKKENIHFWCELSTRIIDKPELVPLLKEAGCVAAVFGIESISEESLISVNKGHNKVNEYKNLFSLFLQQDIPLCPSFVFGFDFDDTTVFSAVFKFLKSTKVQRAIFNILTPYPGTELYENLKTQNRIINNNLSLYDMCHVIFKPNKLTETELLEGYWKLFQKYYNIEEIISRVFSFKNKSFIYSLISNLRFRSFAYKRLYPFNSGVKRIK